MISCALNEPTEPRPVWENWWRSSSATVTWQYLPGALDDGLVVWRLRRACVLKTMGRFEEAWSECERALEQDRHAAIHVAAYTLGLTGRHEEAVALFDEMAAGLIADEADYTHLWDSCWGGRAEMLLYLGRLEEALDACSRFVAPGGFGKGIRARILLACNEPAEALAQADEALQHNCPASAHETPAHVLWARGSRDEAREAHRQFLADVHLYGLQENGVPERVAKARERLER